MLRDPERFTEADEAVDLYLLTIDVEDAEPRLLGPYVHEQTLLGQARLEHDLREHGVQRHLYRLNVGNRISVEPIDHSELREPEPEPKHLLLPPRMREDAGGNVWCGEAIADSDRVTADAADPDICFECSDRLREYAS